MKAVTIEWNSNKEEPPFYHVRDEISNLNEVVLLKHLILRPDGFLNKKMASFKRELMRSLALKCGILLADHGT
jgi:hypothetical protein